MSNTRQKENPTDSWRAPEHSRLTSDMPRGMDGRLIIDNRPNILKSLNMKPSEVADFLRRSYNKQLRRERLAYREQDPSPYEH